MKSAKTVRCRGGFTLVEVLVVTVLVGVLSTIAYEQYTTAIKNAQQRQAQAALKAVATAESVYAMRNHGHYGPITNLITAGLLSNSAMSNIPYTFNVPATAGQAVVPVQKCLFCLGGGKWGIILPPFCFPSGCSNNPPPSSCGSCLACAISNTGGQSYYIDTQEKLYTEVASCDAINPYSNLAGMGSTGGVVSTSGGQPNGGSGSSGGSGGGGGGTTRHGGGCFVAGTPVMTPGGEKAIDRIRPGDVVYAADPASYALVPEKVARVEIKTVDVLLDVALGNGTKFRVTPIHRFYDPATGKFKGIGSFKAGDRVALLKLPEASGLTAVDPAGETWYPAMERDIQIASIKELPLKATRVYNLHMGGRFHDYLVDGVLVHNMKTRLPY